MENKEYPLISIILSVLNGETYLEKTINSIVNQSYKNLELIIIDGGSNDRTLEIIKKFNSRKIKFITEPDKGISDAFNKGINLSSGDYINFQGDGDGFISKFSIDDLFNGINLKSKPIVCANINRINKYDKLIYRTELKRIFDKKSLLYKMSLPHQGLFLPRNFFIKYGQFDLNIKYSMDYELLLRAYHSFPKVIIKDIVVSNWREDGLGEGKTLEILKEYDLIRKKNKVAYNSVLSIIYYYSLFKYYIKKVIF
jgi:glycosyltransferase involved in cell wall biosynthesis